MKRLMLAGALTGALFVGAACAFADALAPRDGWASVVSGASFSEAAAVEQAIHADAEIIRAQLDTFIAEPDVKVPMVRAAVVADSHAVRVQLAVETTDTTKAKRIRAEADTIRRVLQDSIIRRPVYQRLTGYARKAIENAMAHAARIDSLAATIVVVPPPPPPPDTTVVVDTTPPPDTVTPPPPPPVDTVRPPVDTVTLAARAELPRSVPAFSVPAATRSYVVTSGLQAALDTARGGDEIRLSGTHHNILLPSRPCGSWVTIRSNAADSLLPKPGERVAAKHFPYMPAIVTANSAPALKTVNPTCGWRFVGVDIQATASAGVVGVSLNYGIVWLGDGGWLGGGENQVSLAQVPRDIILDRVSIRGTPTTNSTRCLFLNSGATIVQNSYLGDCHAVGFDAQAILGCNGPGPYLIENNYLAGSTENVMFGGCDPAAPELIPSDITIRRNHIVKPLGWKGAGWSVKNLFELKNARRVLVESNVLENSWQSGQAGMAIVLKSSTETCAACTWEGTKDVTVRWNVIREAHIGLNIQAIDGSSAGTTASHTERVTVHDNLFDRIGTANGVAPLSGWLMLLTHDVKDITIHRNTFISNTDGYGLCGYFAYSGGAARRVEITDNICAGRSYYGLAGDGGNHAAALTAFAGSSWRFVGNVISQVEGQFWGLSPSGNTYLTGVAALGLRADGSSVAYPSVGADVAEIARRTAGVVVAP
jgi:hypothetical protein